MAASLPLSSRLAVGVYVHDFQNLDLLAQGWYGVRCRVLHVDGKGGGERPAAAEEVIEVPMNSGVAAAARPACATLDWSLDNHTGSSSGSNNNGDDNYNNNNGRDGGTSGGSSQARSPSSPTSSSSSSSPYFSRSYSSSGSKARVDKTASCPRYSSRALKVLYACEQFPVAGAHTHPSMSLFTPFFLFFFNHFTPFTHSTVIKPQPTPTPLPISRLSVSSLLSPPPLSTHRVFTSTCLLR